MDSQRSEIKKTIFFLQNKFSIQDSKNIEEHLKKNILLPFLTSFLPKSKNTTPTYVPTLTRGLSSTQGVVLSLNYFNFFRPLINELENFDYILIIFKSLLDIFQNSPSLKNEIDLHLVSLFSCAGCLCGMIPRSSGQYTTTTPTFHSPSSIDYTYEINRLCQITILKISKYQNSSSSTTTTSSDVNTNQYISPKDIFHKLLERFTFSLYHQFQSFLTLHSSLEKKQSENEEREKQIILKTYIFSYCLCLSSLPLSIFSFPSHPSFLTMLSEGSLLVCKWNIFDLSFLFSLISSLQSQTLQIPSISSTSNINKSNNTDTKNININLPTSRSSTTSTPPLPPPPPPTSTNITDTLGRVNIEIHKLFEKERNEWKYNNVIIRLLVELYSFSNYETKYFILKTLVTCYSLFK